VYKKRRMGGWQGRCILIAPGINKEDEDLMTLDTSESGSELTSEDEALSKAMKIAEEQRAWYLRSAYIWIDSRQALVAENPAVDRSLRGIALLRVPWLNKKSQMAE
jgi:hypothetical protein